MRYTLFSFGIVLLAVLLICSCSSIPTNTNMKVINDQLELIAFLEDIVNSQENFSVKSFARKTFSHRIKQTKLLTHSFYKIDLSNGEYYTLSFSGQDPQFRLYTDGIWILNKESDMSSYKLFIGGNNIWGVDYLFKEYLIDAQQTLKNIIGAVKIGANYYYRDHLRSRPNSFNCNSAVIETIVLKQRMSQ